MHEGKGSREAGCIGGQLTDVTSRSLRVLSSEFLVWGQTQTGSASSRDGHLGPGRLKKYQLLHL